MIVFTLHSLNPGIDPILAKYLPHFTFIHDHHLYVLNIFGCALVYILMALKCCPSAFKASRLQRVETLTRGGEMEPEGSA